MRAWRTFLRSNMLNNMGYEIFLISPYRSVYFTRYFTADWREERRKRAWELKQAGWKQKDIAVALGVTEGAISQWMKSGREAGEEGLRIASSQRSPSRLEADELAQIPTVLAKGAATYGFVGDAWTGRRLAVAIKREFGISYHPDHCSYLVRKLWGTVSKSQ